MYIKLNQHIINIPIFFIAKKIAIFFQYLLYHKKPNSLLLIEFLSFSVYSLRKFYSCMKETKHEIPLEGDTSVFNYRENIFSIENIITWQYKYSSFVASANTLKVVTG